MIMEKRNWYLWRVLEEAQKERAGKEPIAEKRERHKMKDEGQYRPIGDGLRAAVVDETPIAAMASAILPSLAVMVQGGGAVLEDFERHGCK